MCSLKNTDLIPANLLIPSISSYVPIGSYVDSLEPFSGLHLYKGAMVQRESDRHLLYLISFTSYKISILQMKILKFREVIALTRDHIDNRARICLSTCLILKSYCPLYLDE